MLGLSDRARGYRDATAMPTTALSIGTPRCDGFGANMTLSMAARALRAARRGDRRLTRAARLQSTHATLTDLSTVAWFIGPSTRRTSISRRRPADPGAALLQVSRSRRDRPQGETRLDLREVATAEARSGRKQSCPASPTGEAIRRIFSTDGDVMPPPGEAAALVWIADAQGVDRGRRRLSAALGLIAPVRPPCRRSSR
jgi:hypothetical protein